jgi:hypothetical protein
MPFRQPGWAEHTVPDDTFRDRLGYIEVFHYSYFPDVAATREVDMWKPWQWGHGSHEAALTNAREAATELSRRRVERDDVELYLAQRSSVARLSSRRA